MRIDFVQRLICTRARVQNELDLTYGMATLTATEARANLYKLIEQTLQSHEPVVITGKKGNAVLLSEEDWNAVTETLYLLSVPGMRESIREGMETDVSELAETLGW